MLKISVNFSQKWLQIFTEILVSSASAVVFLFLDFLDVLFCVFFKLIDELFEGKSSVCYCSIENEEEEEKSDNNNENNVLSNTLYKRKNLFRGIGFRRYISSRRKLNENVRWSDCSCENCISWMNNIEAELKLHVVIKEPHPGTFHIQYLNYHLFLLLFMN